MAECNNKHHTGTKRSSRPTVTTPLLAIHTQTTSESNSTNTSPNDALSINTSQPSSCRSTQGDLTAASSTAAPLDSNAALLWDILKLSGPISLTTVVEFLPQILIAAMVGHAEPNTVLPAGDGDTEGAVLTAFGLANLVYSTAAFSLVYGFICGLDSVAASSYGMTLRTPTGHDVETLIPNCPSEYALPTTPCHGASLPSRKIAFNSPGFFISSHGLNRASSIVMHKAARPLGGTPGRHQYSSSVPSVSGFRRSPSCPSNLSLASGPNTSALLGSLEERSAFGKWKRRPDEGIDGPDTPDNEEADDPTHVSPYSLNHEQIAANYHPYSTVGHMNGRSHFDSLSPPPVAHVYSKSTSSTPQPGWESSSHYQFEAIRTTIHATSPGMVPLDLNSTTSYISPITPAPSPAVYQMAADSDTLPPSWDVPILPKTPSIPPTAASSASHNSVQVNGTNSNSHGNISPEKNELPASLIGIWIKRCLMLEMLVVTALIIILYFGVRPFLRLIGEPPAAIDVAADYVTAASFGLPFVAIFHSLNKGLQSSGIVFPILCISFVAKCFSCISIYLGLYHFDMTLIGIAWILTCSIAGQAIAVYCYMQATGIISQWWGTDNLHLLPESSSSSTLGCFSEYFIGLWEYAVLAVPACAAICLEFWLFDILGALAGTLPHPSVELSVHYLLFTTTLASYMIFSGLSVSVSVKVGQKLGCPGQSANAKQSAIVGTIACLCVSCLLILTLIFFHREVAMCLTSQPTLLARFDECIPVLVAYQMVDGLNTCSTQLLRTIGVQKYGVLLHFSTYYLIGMSLGTTLAFSYGYGVFGLWVGLTVGVGLNATLASIWLVIHADWQSLESSAQERTSCQNEPSRSIYSADALPTRAEHEEHHGV